jgi:hypothetical protein
LRYLLVHSWLPQTGPQVETQIGKVRDRFIKILYIFEVKLVRYPVTDGDKVSGAPGIRPQPIKPTHGKDGRKPAGSALAQDGELGNAIGDDFFVIDTQGDPSAANRFSSNGTAGNGADDNDAPMGTGKKLERTREEVENAILRAKQKNMVVLGMEKEKSPGKKRMSKEAKVGSGKAKKAKIGSDS